MNEDLKEYTYNRIARINLEMAIHEGDANRRLASCATRLLLLPIEGIPQEYQCEFKKLQDIVEESCNSLSKGAILPYKLKGIYNKTAAKYILLLWTIESVLED